MLSSAILGFEGTEAFVFNKGSLFVLCACICWGVENNCTRSISDKSSEEIVLVKGIFSGIGSILIAFTVGENRLKSPICLPLCYLVSFPMA